VNAQRPLSQFHSSLTSGSSPAAAQHHAAAVVGALGAAGRAVLAHARAGHQVEGPGPEPVGGAGEGADRADLHGVAAEVGVEGLARGDADLLQRAAFQQRDERVAGDLVGEGSVHRAHSTQRSRSSSTWLDRLIGWGRCA
jgi:hypothetical protein